jgi:hypothetical protein
MRKTTILGLNTGTERVHVKLDEDGHTCVANAIRNELAVKLDEVY